MRVELAGQRFQFPSQCVCCGRSANAVYSAKASKTKGKRVPHTTTRQWDFPYCSFCLRHVGIYDSAIGWAFLAFVGCIVLGYFTFSLDRLFIGIFLSFIPSIVIFILVRIKASNLRAPTCVCAGPAVAYLGWYSSQHTFNIISASYAANFLDSNSRKLINVTEEAHTLLVSARQQSINASIPPVILKVKVPVDESAEALRYVSKIESAKGPVTRKAILEDALGKIRSEALREKIILEASQIETNAVLEKVDQLKSASAKRRILTTAIEELEANGGNTGLQVPQLHRLKSALAEITSEA